MKYLRYAGALALLLVLLLALPALAEGDARMDETSDTFCGATGGVHQVKEWTVTVARPASIRSPMTHGSSLWSPAAWSACARATAKPAR